MKYTLSLVFSFFLLFGNIYSQKTLEKGYLKMQFVESKSDDAQTQSALQSMNGAETEFYFNKDRSYSKITIMGGLLSMRYFTDYKTGETNMLMDAMGQKTLVTGSHEENIKSSTEEVGETIVSYDKSDTKTILGYKTHKALVKFKKNPGTFYEAYVTEEIKASNAMIQGMENFALEGFPLEYTIRNEAMSMTIEAIEIKDDFDKDVFNFDAKGYTKMTMEEFSKSMGGLGAGMGF